MGETPVPAANDARGERMVASMGNALDQVYRAIARTLAAHGFILEYYQRAAVLRRIRRRMHTLSLPALEDYATYIAASAGEAQELIREVSRPQGLLFRDAAVIETLAALLPERLKSSPRPRIWVPACGSGEEVYATAMIVDALLSAAGMKTDFVVYGTDTDRESLRAAQAGVFQNVAAERIPSHLSERHLAVVDGEARIVSDLARRCLFFAHDVIEPSPFVDLDLIVCRNLLQYLQLPLQRHVLERFAAALKPRGLLLLGNMESPLEYDDLFSLPPLAPGLYQRAEQSAQLTESRESARLRDANLHAAIFRSLPAPLMLLDENFTIVEANPAAVTVLGEAAPELMGRELTDWVETADRARLFEALQALSLDRATRAELVLRDGRAVSLDLYRVPGHPGRILVQSVGEGDARLRARLAETSRRMDAVLRSLNDGVIVVDSADLVVELNEQAERLTGWARSEAIDQPLRNVLRLSTVGKDMTESPVAVESGYDEPLAIGGETFLSSRDGRRLAVVVRLRPIPDHGGTVFVIEDVSERKLLTEQLTYRASHDPVTGLLNRDEFEARARAALAEARRSGRSTTLCYIDVDQFKLINDTLGHGAGDEMLHDLAGEMRMQLGENDSLARLGGDEFGVLLVDRDLAMARPVIEALLEVARQFRFQWLGRNYSVTISIGASAIDPTTETITRALSAADAACFAAKDAGRDRARFAGEDDELSRRHAQMSLVGQLGRALEEGRFVLFFEDVVRIDQPDHVVYRELLTRVYDDGGKLISPSAFIQAAERFFLMASLDRWVLHHALRGVAQLPNDDIIYAVNLSGQSLGDDKFLDYVLAELETSHVDPKRICFEITETAAVSRLTEAVRFVKRMSDAGCRFALDDFGAGMASFSYLKNFKVDFLKIDGSFVRSMPGSRADRGMVETINRIGHEMGLRTIAEHVESAALLEPLRKMGVNWAQGRGVALARPFAELLQRA
jgi:diguanylate cyclase (GGDEF)-like protein/PAS domain S-box-containing protein